MNDLPLLLSAVEDCDPHRAEKLLPLVYDELRRLAARKMALQPAGHTLQATALVHEAFLRLIGNPERTWADRRHFFAAAAEAMRHILVDRARRKAALRHGANAVAVEFDEALLAGGADDGQLLALNEALDLLAARDAGAAELVKLRFFGGFTLAEAADVLGVSERTAKRTWSYARAFLFAELRGAPAVA